MASAASTLSTRGWLALPWVEKESIATRGSSPISARQLAAEASAMSASASASGSGFTAQSANISARSASAMTKKLDGVRMPSARPMVIIPASMTRAVGWATPASIASASPAFTIMPAWKRGFRIARSAIFGLPG
jgi:hypothetical protein